MLASLDVGLSHLLIDGTERLLLVKQSPTQLSLAPVLLSTAVYAVLISFINPLE